MNLPEVADTCHFWHYSCYVIIYLIVIKKLLIFSALKHAIFGRFIVIYIIVPHR